MTTGSPAREPLARRLIPAALYNRIAALALAIGLAERLFWALTRKTQFTVDEPGNVAVALVQGRGFADAFLPGQGPTAHLMPTSPLIAAAAYRLFGIHTPLAEGVLLAWALLLVFGTYVLFARAAELVGMAPRAVLAGFVLLATMPTYTTIEAFDFRVWEGGLGLTLGAALLVVVLRVERGVPPRRPALWLALLSAAAFFVHPIVGLAGVAAMALSLWRRRDWRFGFVTLAGSALALAALLGPWVLRNERVMGEPILLRDNVGLELAVANFPGFVAPVDMDAVFYGRLKAIHPYDHPAPFAAMRAAGGEAAYARQLGRETRAWMRANPGDVGRIWTRHLREMLFTHRWMFNTTNGRLMPPFRAGLVGLLAVLALLRLAIAGVRRERPYAYFAAFVLLPVVLYLPFQPTPRYTWLLYPPLAYLASDLVALLVARWRRRAPRHAR